jgi:FtsP/CotA-like multicopper oxidase with cupredoxin domain
MLFMFMAFGVAGFAAELKIEMTQGQWELKPGLSTSIWAYGGTVPGTPIIVRQGERVKIEVVNRLPAATNIHWHGLVLPNDQDGPFVEIQPGSSHTYDFTAGASGTYWYHPHLMPVLPQLDKGLYAPFIVLAPEDGKYSGDHTYVLDDWYLDARGKRLEGVASGDMERYGNIETVNGKTEEAIAPLILRSGELHKLRFINASTAAFHTIAISGHSFRVTHTDGHALAQPYSTDKVTLAPGERIDVELFASGKEGQRFEMTSSRRDLGIVIPIVYDKGSVPAVVSPFSAPQPRAYLAGPPDRPDFTLELSSAMGMMGGGGMMQGGMMGGGMMSGSSALRWTINGKSFPDTVPLDVAVGKLVTMRIYNRDMMSMMMGHQMDHPIHLHGTYFQVVSINGSAPKGELWKDTIPVPSGGYVDIAFVMTNPGTWLLHCHIIDHEDGGMMTAVRAK